MPLSASPTSFDWPEFHQSPLQDGYAANSPLNTTNAVQLGVEWAANLYGPALDSPVVAYDSTLGVTLAYIGTESGNVMAVNIANGQIVWGTWVGSAIRSTPLVTNGSVFIATFTNPSIVKLDATTGAIECSIVAPAPFEATPTVGTPPGGVLTVYIPTTDAGLAQGYYLAVNAGTCSVEWKTIVNSGAWDDSAFAINANGVAEIVFGTANPDSSVYALNAINGDEIWKFQMLNPPPGTYDVGAGGAISPPGVNGFAGGMVYIPSKYGIMYALDLTTGTQVWEVNFNKIAHVSEGGRSTPALDGTNVVFGYNGGLFDFNAITGAIIWRYQDPANAEALSSPAIAGSFGHEIVAVGDVAGGIDVVSLATGQQLYHLQTFGYITASPAVSDGNIIIASTDSFLYDLALGGGHEAVLPSTTITSPVNSMTLANPNPGDLLITGGATDPVAVAAVEVGVQSDGPSGPWWDAATAGWSSGPVDNLATLANPDATTSSWAFEFPAPQAGGTYAVTANAVSAAGQSDPVGAHTGFAVLYGSSGLYLKASPSVVGPGGTVTLTGGGFGSSETVAISLLGVTLATTTSSSTGVLPSTKVGIPSTAVFGRTSLEGVGETSGKTVTTAVTIANSWDMLGYNAGHSGQEPNDTTLYALITPGHDQWVDLAWHFDVGAAVDTSPAIVDGVAYIADTAGQVFAIDNLNGGLIWTWSSPLGGAIDGSPAVDPSQGLVFVGTSNGTGDAIATASGQLVWAQTVGGSLAAPVFGGGEVFVTSSAGTVEALEESDGTVSWTISLGSPTTAAPALDTSNHLLIVGASNGRVEALSTSTGAMSWTFAAGGAIDATATIFGGTVYVGSADDNVYALSESTGAKVWAYKTGGPVEDTGTISDSGTGNLLLLMIGSNNGMLYALEIAHGGSLHFTESFGSPITGVASVK